MAGSDDKAKKALEQRKVLLAALVYERQHGQPATWGQLRAAAGIRSARDFNWLMLGMRKRGLVSFEVDVERSLRVTDAGARAALEGRR